MIYIYESLGTSFIKLGYTKNTNVYYRIKDGFGTNKHPSELCGKLEPLNLKLNCVFQGDTYIESVMKTLFPPFCGEFYKKEYLNILTTVLGFITIDGPIFERPHDDFFAITFEKLLCCGGQVYNCTICNKVFQREHKLYEHTKEVHNGGNRVSCLCGKLILKRNLKRHRENNCN